MKLINKISTFAIAVTLAACTNMPIGNDTSKPVVVYGYASKMQLVNSNISKSCSDYAINGFNKANKNANDYGFGAIVAFENSAGECTWQSYKYMHSVEAAVQAAQIAIKIDVGKNGEVVAQMVPVNYTQNGATTMVDWDGARTWMKNRYVGKPNYGAIAISSMGDVGGYASAPDLQTARDEAMADCQESVTEKISKFSGPAEVNAVKKITCRIVHERTPEGLRSSLTVY